MIYKTIFQNNKIIVAEKMQGIVTEPEGKKFADEICLLEAVQNDFSDDNICLCHRLDRNTGGLIILAKNNEIYNSVCELMNKGDIKKTYEALVFGKPNTCHIAPGKDGFTTLTAFHFKDAKLGRVYIYDAPKKFAKKIITKYKLLSYDGKNNTSRLEIVLETGRTHQIRAQFAHLGNPVCGDGKYGKNSQNRQLKLKYQALWAKKISFSKKAAAILDVPECIESTPNFV